MAAPCGSGQQDRTQEEDGHHAYMTPVKGPGQDHHGYGQVQLAAHQEAFRDQEAQDQLAEKHHGECQPGILSPGRHLNRILHPGGHQGTIGRGKQDLDPAAPREEAFQKQQGRIGLPLHEKKQGGRQQKDSRGKADFFHGPGYSNSQLTG